MSYNVYFIAGDYSRQAAKAPPPRAPAAVVSMLRPTSEVRPALPNSDGIARFDPPRRPPGPRSVVLEGAQRIGRPPADPSSLRPVQPPPLRSRSSRSRRPRQTRSRSDSRARSRSPGPSVSEVRSEARSLQQAHHTYPPGNWGTSLGVFDIYGHSGQFQERPPPPPPPPRPEMTQTVRSVQNSSLNIPLGSAPFNAFPISSTPTGHAPLNDHEYSLFETLLNQQVKEHPTSEAFLQHVAKLLAQADILSQDLGPMRMAKYDPNYYGSNQGSDQPAPMEHFYILPISVLYNRANLPEGMPPPPRRAAPDRGLDEIIHLAFTHATKLGSFVAILKEGKLAPSKLHFAESESFFAQGFKVGYTSWEAHELGRILHNGTNLSKNECGAIFVGLAWGTGTTVHSGGEGECIDLTRGPNSQGCVHHKRGSMWVINTHSHYLTGIAWRSDSQAPVRLF